MFISAIRLHCNLNGATLTSAASDCDCRNEAFSSIFSEAHLGFRKVGILHRILTFDQRAPSSVYFYAHHIHANS